MNGGGGSDQLYVFFNSFGEFSGVDNTVTATTEHFQLTRTDGGTETVLYEDFERWVVQLTDGNDRFIGLEGPTTLYGLDGDDELFGWGVL